MQLSSITRQRFANNQWHTDKFKEVVFFLDFQRRKQQKDTANAIDSKRCHTKMHDMEARIPCYQRRIKTIKSKQQNPWKINQNFRYKKFRSYKRITFTPIMKVTRNEITAQPLEYSTRSNKSAQNKTAAKVPPQSSLYLYSTPVRR